MSIQFVPVSKVIFVVLLSGILIGITGVGEPVLSATDPVSSTDQQPPAATSDSPAGAGKGHLGRGRHSMRKACAEDVKVLCSDVKAGQGRIGRCLKQHVQELSQSCADMIRPRGTSGR